MSPRPQDISTLIAMRHKSHLVVAIDSDKGTILDIRKKHVVRTIPKWSGGCTKDGRYGLYAPSRSGHQAPSTTDIYFKSGV
jgi:hypothetical protein